MSQDKGAQVIPEVAVEAAARAMTTNDAWQRYPEQWRNDYRESARYILEAAAPHMIPHPPLVQEFGPIDAAKYQPPGHGPIH